METLRSVSLLAAVITTGLMAGIYLAFSIAVMPGLRRLDDAAYVAGLRGINVAILNPVFLLVFLGPLVLDLVASATRLGHDGLGWTLVGLVLYVMPLVVTAAVNVPLNNLLASTEPAPDARAGFEDRWARWNVVRTIASTASLVALVVPLS